MNAPAWFTCLANLFQLIVDLYRRLRMSTPTPILETPSQLGADLKADVKSAFGTPLMGFAAAVQSAQGDTVKQAAALVALQGQLVAAVPGFVGPAEGQIAGLIAYELSRLFAPAPAAPTTPAAPATPAS